MDNRSTTPHPGQLPPVMEPETRQPLAGIPATANVVKRAQEYVAGRLRHGGPAGLRPPEPAELRAMVKRLAAGPLPGRDPALALRVLNASGDHMLEIVFRDRGLYGVLDTAVRESPGRAGLRADLERLEKRFIGDRQALLAGQARTPGKIEGTFLPGMISKELADIGVTHLADELTAEQVTKGAKILAEYPAALVARALQDLLPGVELAAMQQWRREFGYLAGLVAEAEGHLTRIPRLTRSTGHVRLLAGQLMTRQLPYRVPELVTRFLEHSTNAELEAIFSGGSLVSRLLAAIPKGHRLRPGLERFREGRYGNARWTEIAAGTVRPHGQPRTPLFHPGQISEEPQERQNARTLDLLTDERASLARKLDVGKMPEGDVPPLRARMRELDAKIARLSPPASGLTPRQRADDALAGRSAQERARQQAARQAVSSARAELNAAVLRALRAELQQVASPAVQRDIGLLADQGQAVPFWQAQAIVERASERQRARDTTAERASPGRKPDVDSVPISSFLLVKGRSGPGDDETPRPGRGSGPGPDARRPGAPPTQGTAGAALNRSGTNAATFVLKLKPKETRTSAGGNDATRTTQPKATRITQQRAVGGRQLSPGTVSPAGRIQQLADLRQTLRAEQDRPAASGAAYGPAQAVQTWARLRQVAADLARIEGELSRLTLEPSGQDAPTGATHTGQEPQTRDATRKQAAPAAAKQRTRPARITGPQPGTAPQAPASKRPEPGLASSAPSSDAGGVRDRATAGEIQDPGPLVRQLWQELQEQAAGQELPGRSGRSFETARLWVNQYRDDAVAQARGAGLFTDADLAFRAGQAWEHGWAMVLDEEFGISLPGPTARQATPQPAAGAQERPGPPGRQAGPGPDVELDRLLGLGQRLRGILDALEPDLWLGLPPSVPADQVHFVQFMLRMTRRRLTADLLGPESRGDDEAIAAQHAELEDEARWQALLAAGRPIHPAPQAALTFRQVRAEANERAAKLFARATQDFRTGQDQRGSGAYRAYARSQAGKSRDAAWHEIFQALGIELPRPSTTDSVPGPGADRDGTKSAPGTVAADRARIVRARRQLVDGKLDAARPAASAAGTPGTSSDSSTAPTSDTTLPPEGMLPEGTTPEDWAELKDPPDRERAWQEHRVTARMSYPADEPPTRDSLTAKEALAEVDAAVAEVMRAYAESVRESAEPDVPQAHARFDGFVVERQARAAAWMDVYRSLGIDPPVVDTTLGGALREDFAAPWDTALRPSIAMPPTVTPQSTAVPQGAPTAQATAIPPLTSTFPVTASLPPSSTPTAWEPLDLPASRPGVTYLRAPRDTVFHAQAGLAAPTALGWETLLGHGQGGSLSGADVRVIAHRLGLFVPANGPDGQPAPPPENPVKVMLLACDAEHVAAELHALTGGVHEVLVTSSAAGWEGGPDSRAIIQAIMLPETRVIGGVPVTEVIAGTWETRNGQVVPALNGDFVLYRGGQRISLGTPSVTEALRDLGASFRPRAAEPPTEPVGFYYGPTPAQTAALDAAGYELLPDELPRTDSEESFQRALIAVAGPLLRRVLGADPTPELVAERVERALEQDLASDHPRYAELIADDRAAEPLSDPRQAARLWPHVAADVFGFDLRVLGALGHALPAGYPGGPGRTDTAGNPFLLARLPGGRFAPAVPRAGTSRATFGGTDPDSERPPGETPWSEPLGAAAQQLAEQEVAEAPLPAGSAEPVLLGRVAEMNVLARAPGIGRPLGEPDLATVGDSIRRWLTRDGAPGAPTQQERTGILARLEALDRVAKEAESELKKRGRDLQEQYLRAVAQAGPRSPAGRGQAGLPPGSRIRDALEAAARQAEVAAARRAGAIVATDFGYTPARQHIVVDGPRLAPQADLGAVFDASIDSSIEQLAGMTERLARAWRSPELGPGSRPRESDLAWVRDVIRRWLTRDGTPGAPTQQERPGILARLEELEQLADAADAATVRVIAELGGALRAARDTPASGTDAASGIRAALEAFDASVPSSVEQLAGMTERLARAQRWLELAPGFRQRLEKAELAAADVSESAAAEGRGRPHWDAALKSAQWQARKRSALEEFSRGAVDRELPPGFGVGGEHPWGHQSRLERLGDVSLHDWGSNWERIAEKVAEALPPGERALREGVKAEVLAFLKAHGRHTFSEQLLNGDLTFQAGPPHAPVPVPVTLHLGDMSLAHHLKPLQEERTPIGQKGHHAVEGERTGISTQQRTVVTARSATVTGNVLVPFTGTGGPWTATAGFGVSAASSTSHSNRVDGVTAIKRAPRYEGLKAYFDFPGASLRTVVRDQTGTLPLIARAAFPEEVCPVKEAGDPPGAFRPVPRTLPGTQRLGISQAEVTAAGPAGEAAALRVASVLHRFMTVPQWAAGWGDIRDQVNGVLARIGVRDPQVTESVRATLSEKWFLRNYGGITGDGATSPWIRDSKGRETARLIIAARLRSAQASTVDHLGVKEETQRFTNNWDSKAHSGSVSLHAPMFEFAHQFGHPNAPLGAYSNLSVGGSLSGSLSSTQTHNANTGSGDIRGLVYWRSVLQLSEWDVRVQVVPKRDTQRVPQAVYSSIGVGLRIPEIQRDRFEYELRAAVGAPAGPVPVDDQPDEQNSRRYPPAALTAGQGIDFAVVSHLAGREKVLPRLLKMIQKVGRDEPRIHPWTPSALTDARAELSNRFGAEGLQAHADALFQPGGTRWTIFRPARSGVEAITVQVWATHAAQPSAWGRVAHTTQEGMPSTFAGQSGSDSFEANAGFTVSVNAFAGLGSRTHARTFGGMLQGGGSLGTGWESGAGASGFALQANLHTGPGRTWDYRAKFHLKVVSRIEASPRSALFHLAYDKAKDLASKARTKQEQEQEQRRTVTDELPAEVRFILVEDMASREPPDPATIATVGKVDVRSFPAARALAEIVGVKPVTEVELPSFLDFPGTGQHTPLTQDDLLVEVLGSQAIGDSLARLLAKVGMKEASVGDLPWTIASPEHLGAALVHGRPVTASTIVQDGISHDRFATVTLELFPVDAQAQPELAELLLMHVAESDGFVQFSTTKKKAGGGVFGLPYLNFGGIGAQWAAQGSYGQTFAGSRTSMANETATTGRLTQQKILARKYVGAIIGRQWVTARSVNLLTTNSSNKVATLVNSLTRRGMTYAGEQLKVHNGFSFMRRVTPAPDPRQPAPAPAGGTIALIASRPAGSELPPASPRPGLGPDRPQVPQMILIPTIQATLRADETRMVPMLPLIPPGAMVDRLYPVPREPLILGGPPAGNPAATGEAGIIGDGEPVLTRVQQRLGANAQAWLESHTTVKGGGGIPVRQVRPELQNVLNRGSLTSMWDLVSGPGLVLDASRPVRGGSERLQIEIRVHQDAHNLGHDFLGTVPLVNSVRYSFGLSTENASWATIRGSGVGGAQPQQAGLEGGFGFTGGESGGPGEHVGVARNASIEPGGGFTRFTSKQGYDQQVKADRDTVFRSGRSDYYGDDVLIEIRYQLTWSPGRSLNALGLNIPHYVASWAQDTNNQRRMLATDTVPMKARDLIPHELLQQYEELPEVPRGAAIEEVDPAAPPPGRPLNLTPTMILSRQAITSGWHAQKLQIHFDEVMPKLAGNERPLSGERSHAVARLIAHGTRGWDALHYMLSYQMFTRHLEDMLGDGMTMPEVAVPGGPVTDSHGKFTVKVRLANPHPLGWSTQSWAESVRYGFDEKQSGKARSTSVTPFSITTGGALNTGDLQPGLSPLSPDRQVLTGTVGASFTSSTERTSGSALQLMDRVDAVNRAIPRLWVSADAIVTVTGEAWNERAGIRLPGGTVTVSHLIRHAVTTELSPELSIELSLYHRGGIPAPSGLWHPGPPSPEAGTPPRYADGPPPYTDVVTFTGEIPDAWPSATPHPAAPTLSEAAPASTDDVMRAAFSVPFLDHAFAVQGQLADDKVLTGDAELSLAEFTERLRRRLSQLPAEPPADRDPEERPPPGPKQLSGPDDPIVALIPYAAAIQPGHTTSVAQVVSSQMSRPVVGLRSSYRITQDGAVLGEWVLVQPRTQEGVPLALPHNLDQALAATRRLLNSPVGVGGRPPLVAPPSQDIDFGVQTPEAALGKWRRDVTATHRLAAAARELLPPTGLRDLLESNLHEHDLTVRAIPGPPGSLPATAADRAAAWQDLAQFQRAAAELGIGAAEIIQAAIGQWAQTVRFVSALPEQVRALLPPERQVPASTAALARLDEAVRAVPPAPVSLPLTADAVTATRQSIALVEDQVQEVSNAMAAVLTSAIGDWTSRLTAVQLLAGAARDLLPFTGARHAALLAQLDAAETALPDPPALPLATTESMDAARHALTRLADLESATRALLAAATDLYGLQKTVAEHPALVAAAREMLPYTGARQQDLAARLDQAAAHEEQAKPTWWRASGAELTSVAEVEATRKGLDNDEQDQVDRAARDLDVVLAEVREAAVDEDSWLAQSSQLAFQLLPYVGELRPQLERELGTAEHPRTFWPELGADAEAEVAAAARRRASLEDSIQRRVDAAGSILTATIRTWQDRRAAVLELAHLAWGLLPAAGPRRDDLAVGLEGVHQTVRSSELPAGPFATAQQITSASSEFLSMARNISKLAAQISAISRIMVEQPLGSMEGHARDLARLLPYLSDQQPELTQKLTDELVDLGLLRLEEPEKPEEPSSRGLLARPPTGSTPSLRASAATTADSGPGSRPQSRRPSWSATSRRHSWASVVSGSRRSSWSAIRQPGALFPTAKGPLDELPSVADMSAAKARLDRLQARDEFRATARAVFDGGWRLRRNALTSLLPDLRDLLGHIDPERARELRQRLNQTADSARSLPESPHPRPMSSRRASRLRRPGTAEPGTAEPGRPESRQSWPVPEVEQTLARMNRLEEAASELLTEAARELRARRPQAADLAAAAEALVPYVAAREPSVGAALKQSQQALKQAQELPVAPPVTAAGVGAVREVAARVAGLEEITERIVAAARQELGALQERVDTAADLAATARRLLPHTGAEQAGLTHALSEAAERLQLATPGWWTESSPPPGAGAGADAGAGLAPRIPATAAQVEQAAQALHEAALAGAAADTERAVRDVLTAASGRWADTAEAIRAAGQRMRDERSDPRGGSRDPLDQLLRRAERAGPPVAWASSEQATAEEMTRVVRAMTPVLDLEAALRDVLDTVTMRWRTNAAGLTSRAAQVRDLLPLTDAPGALGASLKDAERTVRDLAGWPVPPLTTAEALDRTRDARARLRELGAAVMAVVTPAMEQLRQRARDGRQLARLVSRELPDSGPLRPALARLGQAAHDVAQLQYPAAPLEKGPAAVSQAVTAARQALTAVTVLEAATRQVLALATAGLRAQAAAATTRAEAARGLLPHVGDEAATAQDTANTHARAEAARRLEKALQAMRGNAGHLAGRRLPRTEASLEGTRLAMGQVTELEAATTDVLTWADHALSRRAQDVRAVWAAEAVAEAARELLPRIGDQRADLSARLDAAVEGLRSRRPNWWPGQPEEVTTAVDIDAAVRALSQPVLDFEEAQTAAQRAVTDVLAQAALTLQTRERELGDRVAAARRLLPDPDGQQASLDKELAAAATGGAAPREPRPATLAGVEAASRDFERMTSAEAELTRVAARATATTGLEQRLAASRKALTAATAAAGLNQAWEEADDARRVAAVARMLLDPELAFTDAEQEGLANRLDRPVGRLHTLQPSQWQAREEELTTVADQLRSVTRDLSDAAEDAHTAAGTRWAAALSDAREMAGTARRILNRLGARRPGVQRALDQLQPVIGRLGKPPALPARPEPGWKASDRADALHRATAEMREASDRLDALLRATGQLRSELEAAPWRRAYHLLRGHDPQLAPQDVHRSIALADRLIAEAGQQRQPDQVTFAQLARQIGMHHRDSPMTRSFHQMVDPPEAAMTRLLGFLVLADTVFDDGSATLDRVTNLRRLADLVLAARGPAGGPREATLAELRAEAVRQPGAPLPGVGLAQRVRHLAAQVGQAKWAKQQAAAGVPGQAAGRVTRRDMAALARAAELVRQARRHVDAEIDLDATERAELIWGLLDGLVTDDAREAVIDLLRATPQEDLGRLFAGPRWLADRLVRVIRPSHPVGGWLDDWVTERYGPGVRLPDLGWASVSRAKPPLNREFTPRMISEALAGLKVDDDVPAEKLVLAGEATRDPSSEAIIRKHGLSRQRSGYSPSEHDQGLAYLRQLHEAADRSGRIEAARNGEIDLDTDQMRDLATAALEGVARWQARDVLRLLHGTELDAIHDALNEVLERRIPAGHSVRDAIAEVVFKWIDPDTGDQYEHVMPWEPFSLDMISEELHGLALRADRSRDRLTLIGRELTETDEEIRARIDMASPRERAKLDWWLREEGAAARDVHRARQHLSADWNAELSLTEREPLIARLADGPAAWQAQELLADMDSHELARVFPDGARGALWDRLTSAIPPADLRTFRDGRFAADGAVRMDVQPPLPFRPSMISELLGQNPGTELTPEEVLDTAAVIAARSDDEILGPLGLRPRDQKTGRLWLGDVRAALVDLAVRRWSGNPAFQLGAEYLWLLTSHLLALIEHRPADPATDQARPAADRVRRVLIATLQSMNADELNEIYYRELRGRLEWAVPGGPLRVQLNRFFDSWLDAHGQPRMDVQPTRSFGWDLVHPSLDDVPLTWDQIQLAASGIGEQAERQLVDALSELDPQARAVAAWELTRLRVALHDMSMNDEDSGAEPARAKLDRVLDWLYHDHLQRIPDAAWLSDLTSTPPASQRQRLREALSPPALVQREGHPESSFRNQLVGEAKTFREKLEKALGDDIAGLERRHTEPVGAGEKYDLDGRIGPMAVLAQEWIKEVLGPLEPESVPVVTAQPGQAVDAGSINVYDISDYRRWEIEQQPDSHEKTVKATIFMTLTLLLRSPGAQKVLAQHHANLKFDKNAVARNEEGRIVEDAIKNLLKNEDFRDRVLNIWAHWAAASKQKKIFVSIPRRLGPVGNPQLEVQGNQQLLYGVALNLLHEMWHAKLSDGYNRFIESLPGEHERNTLNEGVTSRLTKWAWTNLRRRFNSSPGYYQGVRHVIEGQEYAGQAALRVLPDPAMARQYDSHAEVARVISQTGFLNLIEAVSHDPQKISGPAAGSRSSLLAPGGTAAASFRLPPRPATPDSSTSWPSRGQAGRRSPTVTRFSATVTSPRSLSSSPAPPPRSLHSSPRSLPSSPRSLSSSPAPRLRSPSPSSLSPRPVSPEPLSSHLPPPREQADPQRLTTAHPRPARSARHPMWVSPSTGAASIGPAELADGRLRPTTPPTRSGDQAETLEQYAPGGSGPEARGLT